MMCGGMGAAAEDDPMADKPAAKPKQSGMCPCCGRMAMMRGGQGGMGGMQHDMPGMEPPKQQRGFNADDQKGRAARQRSPWVAVPHARGRRDARPYRRDQRSRLRVLRRMGEASQSEWFHRVGHESDDLDGVKTKLGIPEDLRTCHTGQMGDYL